MSSETAQDRDRDFTSLEAWKKAREVKLFFYQKILPKLPPEEKYNLNIQIRKASVSGLRILPRVMDAFITQKASSFIESLEAR